MEARTRFLLPGGHRWLRAHVMGVQLLAQLLVLLLALLALVVLAPRVGYAQASTWVEVERRVSSPTVARHLR